jgi:hypothetical protein
MCGQTPGRKEEKAILTQKLLCLITLIHEKDEADKAQPPFIVDI